MKENIEDYRKDGLINLDEYFSNNPSSFVYPYYIDGYDKMNFWALLGKEDDEKYVYVKPRQLDEENSNYNIYAELIYEELLNQIGIKTANFDLAKYEGKDATISENILDGYNKNQFLINGCELLDGKSYFSNDEFEIEDLFDAIHDYCKAEYIDENMENKCITDIQKACIADIFTLSTDRKATDFDFIVGSDKNGKEVIELAPLCHNTYPLGSNYTLDEMYDMLDNDDMLSDMANLCYYDAGVPQIKRNTAYPYWEDTLYYLIEENDSLLDFAQKCAKKMDINLAIDNVEKKINNNIPIEYKEFMSEMWNNRLQNICECLDIDYYKLLDEKENEMEEI